VFDLCEICFGLGDGVGGVWEWWGGGYGVEESMCDVDYCVFFNVLFMVCVLLGFDLVV